MQSSLNIQEPSLATQGGVMISCRSSSLILALCLLAILGNLTPIAVGQEARPRSNLPTEAVVSANVTGSEVKSAKTDSDTANRESVKPIQANLSGHEELAVGAEFAARDSLSCGQESNEDAQQCLEGLSWQAEEFKVTLAEGRAEERMDRMVRFDSPQPLGDSVNDLVALEWYMAFGSDGRPVKAPAVVVVHESGSGMTVGRLIAKGLRAHGVHALMMHMPGYGVRKSGQIGEAHSKEADALKLIPAMKQAIADARRARDAVSVLPFVDDSLIGIQGTSLGGFVTASVGGLDAGFDKVFVLLAGGDLNQVIFNGAKDAANVRKRLEEAGATREMIMEGTRHIEPLRIAHRLRPEATWLYSGKFDDVVPPACSHALAKAASLPAEHHIEMPVDHYSGALYLPKVLLDIAKIMESPKYKK